MEKQNLEMERNEIRSDDIADIANTLDEDPEGEPAYRWRPGFCERDMGLTYEEWEAEKVLRSDSDRREFETFLDQKQVSYPSMVEAISDRWKKDRADLLRLVRDTLAESISYMPEPNGGRKAGFRKNRDNPVS